MAKAGPAAARSIGSPGKAAGRTRGPFPQRGEKLRDVEITARCGAFINIAGESGRGAVRCAYPGYEFQTVA